MMKWIVWLVVLCGVAFGGIFNGTIDNQSGRFTPFVVGALGITDLIELATGGLDSLDFSSLPVDILFFTTEWEIEGPFGDGLPYTVFAFGITSISDMTPRSGDPMGLYPTDVYPFGGSYFGLEVPVDDEGYIGGTISVDGPFRLIKIDAYDMMTGSEVYEATYKIDHPEYHVLMPAGFKMLDCYVDLNDNDIWDGDEVGVDYWAFSIWGPIVFAGGGGRFDHDVDFNLTAIEESSHAKPSLRLTNTPNPFNDATNISWRIPDHGTMVIRDMSGKIVMKKDISSSGEITWGSDMSSGIYMVNIFGGGASLSRRVQLIK